MWMLTMVRQVFLVQIGCDVKSDDNVNVDYGATSLPGSDWVWCNVWRECWIGSSRRQHRKACQKTSAGQGPTEGRQTWSSCWGRYRRNDENRTWVYLRLSYTRQRTLFMSTLMDRGKSWRALDVPPPPHLSPFSANQLHEGQQDHHHHQSLNREGRWGTTGDFATSFLHFPLFSTAF